jgi:type IX secretion system PorP/SprF family membrane protein
MGGVYIKFCFLCILFFSLKNKAQETLPIYSDYLSDNVFLVHPAAAGIGNSSKLRLTARQQWIGVPNAPALQTISFHSKLGDESSAAYGFVLFNDKNGFHSQKGVQGTYAYHLPLTNGSRFEQLSFGLAFSFIQSQSDQRSFSGDAGVNQIIESTSYYNADFSMAYHNGGWSSYFTAKNLFLTAKSKLSVTVPFEEPLNIGNYVFSVGYYFGQRNFLQLEPSIMVQLREGTGEKVGDFNLKVYNTYRNIQIWAALSYRRNFDAGSMDSASYITPVIGFNYKDLMFSYTHTKQLNEVLFAASGFHQISIGFNLLTRKRRWNASPNINGNLRISRNFAR